MAWIRPDAKYREKGKHTSRAHLRPLRPAKSEARPDAWKFYDEDRGATRVLAPEQVVRVRGKRKRGRG